MNYIILDLEATCWEGWDKSQNETIEIGAVLLNGKGQLVSEFAQFVKPLNHPILSDFCKELTTIKQQDVGAAPYFDEAIERFKAWFGYPDQGYLLCSWGFYDHKQLKSDCAIHGLDSQWVDRHISLKHQYAKFKKLRRAIGMANALKHEGLLLEGTHHRGIDDARNIAKVFTKYLNHWNTGDS